MVGHMSRAEKFEAEIQRPTAAGRAEWARWLQDRCDPAAGPDLRPQVGAELDGARQEVARRDEWPAQPITL